MHFLIKIQIIRGFDKKIINIYIINIYISVKIEGLPVQYLARN